MKRDHFDECENYRMHYRVRLDDGLSEVRTSQLHRDAIYHISTQGASKIVNSVGFSIDANNEITEDLSRVVPEKLLVKREVEIPLEGKQDKTEVFECHKFQGDSNSLNVDFKLID